jgi:hypothetical protein
MVRFQPDPRVSASSAFYFILLALGLWRMMVVGVTTSARIFYIIFIVNIVEI